MCGEKTATVIVALFAISGSVEFSAGVVAADYCNEENKKTENLTGIATFPCFKQNENWKFKADSMVDTQVKARGVKDTRVLDAMRKTPRHLFVPELYRKEAYEDHPLPIGHAQTISQPYIVGLMTELLNLKTDDTVLEIGTGSGYQSAILSHIVTKVYSIELVKALADSSSARLKHLGYDNVTVKCGDGYSGWKEHAPFDAIILTAAPKEIPQELVNQLKEGGRMVVPVGANPGQELFILTKKGDTTLMEKNISVRFVPMVHTRRE